MDIITTDYDMADGTRVPLSLNYGLLFKLRAKDKDAYKTYNDAMVHIQDEPEYNNAVILYTAYLCGHLLENGSLEGTMDMDEFFTNMSQNRQYNGRITNEIYSPNRKTASAKRS